MKKPLLFLFFVLNASLIFAQDEVEDTTNENFTKIIYDSIPYKFGFNDRRSDFYSTPIANPFEEEMRNESINKSIVFKPHTKSFIVKEEVSNTPIRPTVEFSNAEMEKFIFRKADENYFRRKGNFILFLNQRGGIPQFSANYFIFNNIFGVNEAASKLQRSYDTTKAVYKDVKEKNKSIYQDFKSSVKTSKSLFDTSSTKRDSLLRASFGLKKDSSKNKDTLSFYKKIKSVTREDMEREARAFDSAQLISINPKGFIDFIVGFESFETNNPSIPINLRYTSNPLFDMKYDFNLNSVIGSKLKLPLGLSNLTNFDLRNPLYIVSGVSAAAAIASTSNAINAGQNAGFGGYNPSTTTTSDYLAQGLKRIKLNFKGDDDQIVKFIEAGVTSFETQSTIIPSTKDLFGITTKLKFGKLDINGTISVQNSKLKVINLSDGSLSQSVKIRASEYEDNRNFLLAHYFRNKFNTALKKIPFVQSDVQILRVEVWVTNRNSVTNDTREIIAFTDMAECGNGLMNNSLTCLNGTDDLPYNDKNNLYQKIIQDPNLRNSRDAVELLNNMGFVQGKDYEKVYAKKVNSSNYYFNSQLGVLMLSETVSNESVVGVSYEYQVNGKNYKVGEFSEDVSLNQSNDLTKILFVKLLKTITPQPRIPLWKLTLRNVYNLGTGVFRKENFNIQVVYDEPSKGEKIYHPYAETQYKKTIVELINADRLNNNNDFIKDGIFDYVENITVFPDKGKIMFPTLEPFGRDMTYIFDNEISAQKYLYYSLYDSIKSYAAQQIFSNRYVVKGNIKSGNSSQIFLGAFNIPQGSVKITQAGSQLIEGSDFTIDYNIGALTILNKNILDAKLPLVVQLEDNAVMGFQQKTFIGARAGYEFTKDIKAGITYTRYKESPLNYKVLYGQEAVYNQMMGFDINYKFKSRAISYFLDKALPFYVTKEKSTVNIQSEFVKYQPGYNSFDQFSPEGAIYLDDFENSYSNVFLNNSPSFNWSLASVPKNATNENGEILFPEASLFNNLDINKNRAHTAWYQIDLLLQSTENSNNPAIGTNLYDARWRRVSTQEVFPSTSFNNVNYSSTFDIAYFPKEKGAYNFETSKSELNENGEFLFPKKKFGGISYGFQDQSNFEDKNIEYVQFWMQDPFIDNPNSNGGDMYINLGNVSEDILQDGLRMYENGLPTPSFNAQTQESIFGKVPLNPTPVSTTFINVANERVLQDVGIDGVNDDDERKVYKNYLNDILNNFGFNSNIYKNVYADPSLDNFVSEREPTLPSNTDLLQRYKYFNNTQNNSRITTSATQVYASTTLPDKEDLNNDNILNQNEDYFQYHLKLTPNMSIGSNFVVDKRTVSAYIQSQNEAAPSYKNVNWYLFKIPLSEYYSKVGNIYDFKSIRFMRMFLNNFQENVVLRLLKFSLIANNWRRFNYAINHSGNYENASSNNLFVTNINVEENDRRYPIPYSLPPGIERIQQNTSNNLTIFQNEQSLSIRANNLKKDEAKGIFRNFGLNLINYGKLDLFIHAESITGEMLVNDNEVQAVVRLSTDYASNYYEIVIPLKITPVQSSYSREDIWPEINNLNLDLSVLTNLKLQRNKSGSSTNQIYTQEINGRKYSVMGNPNLADVKGILFGLNNTTTVPKSIEVWINELRLSKMNLQESYAGNAKIDMQLADLGTMVITSNFYTAGFGNLEQKINDRSRNNFIQYNITTKLDLSKFLPDKVKMNLPFFMNVSQSWLIPEYDPFDPDIKYSDKLNSYNTQSEKDAYSNRSIEYNNTQTYSLTNVKVLPKGNEKISFYSIKLWEFNYTYSEVFKRTPYIELSDFSNHNASAIYNFNFSPIYLYPFSGAFKKSKSNLSKIIKDLNFNFAPSQVSFKIQFERQFNITKARSIVEDDDFSIPEYYDKKFIINRTYIYKWIFTKSISINFKANNLSRVDEPFGRINNLEKNQKLFSEMFKGGRNIIYNQDYSIVYTLPTQNIKILKWTNFKLSYSGNYIWTSAPDSLFYLGHTIQNMSKTEYDLTLNFSDLYKKYFDKKRRKVKSLEDLSFLSEPNIYEAIMFTFQKARITFSESYNSTVNGFMLTPQILGNQLSDFAPGLDYAFGASANKQWLDKISKNNWITHDKTFNLNFLQSFQRTISSEWKLKLIPFTDITLIFNYSYGRNYTELFKDTTGNGTYAHLNPFDNAKIEMSYWAFETLFDNYSNSQISDGFKNFLKNRAIISKRIAFTENISTTTNGGYYKGYDEYSQNVLIPAFVAAYTKTNANNIPLIDNKHSSIQDNPFSGYFPRPNWNINYYGLSHIPFLRKLFSIIKLTNAYNGVLNSNNIQSNPTYLESLIGIPVFVNSTSNNLVPYYRIPNITVADKFDPLIGVEIVTTNRITMSFKYSKERTVSLSLVDFQISENYKEQYGFGFGGKFNGPKRLDRFKQLKKWKNEFAYKLNITYMQDFNFNVKLNQEYKTPTGGNTLYSVLPSIEYTPSVSLTFKIFYEYRSSTNNLTQLTNINQRGGLLLRLSF